jgi:hypothetical protein
MQMMVYLRKRPLPLARKLHFDDDMADSEGYVSFITSNTFVSQGNLACMLPDGTNVVSTNQPAAKINQKKGKKGKLL